MIVRVALVVAVLISCAGVSIADTEPKVVPLEDIYGYHRRLRELEPELFIKRDTPEKIAEYSTPEKLQEIRDKAEESLTLPIERAMQSLALNQGKSDSFADWKPAPGFAVAGRDRDALARIHAVIVEGKKPTNEFATTDDITIVFFALRANGLRLFNASRTDDEITLHYGFLASGNLTSHWHLSLIPIGKLPPGEYKVKYLRSLTLEKEAQKDPRISQFGNREAGGQEKVICGDFVFKITN